MITYNCTITHSGKDYPAVLHWDEKNNTGTVISQEFGIAALSDVKTVSSDTSGYGIKAGITLDGYDAEISAAGIGGPSLTGDISYGWFFSADFVGTKVA